MTKAIAFEARRCDHIVENDGTVSLMVKIDPSDSRAFLAASPDAGGTLFIAPGLPDLGPMEPLHLSANYSVQARALKESGFFFRLAVWRQCGSNDQFLDWLRDQSCWVQAMPSHICCGAIVPAHVRRIANGAGVAIKPEFSAIPLCNRAHSDQHQHGESAIGGRDRVDVARLLYLQKWSSNVVLDVLGYKTWCHVPPYKLRDWARERGLCDLLPPEYRRASL